MRVISKKASFLVTVIIVPWVLLSGAGTPPADCGKSTIVLDFHGVLAKFNWRGALNAIRVAFSECPTIREKANFFVTLLKPSTFRSGHYVQNPSLRRIYNESHELNPEMVRLVQELKESGHLVILFTNLDSISLAEWREKNRDVFENFSAIHNVTVDPDGTYHAELRKKNPAAYTSCATLVNRYSGGAPVVLIDDKPKVLDMAQKFMGPDLLSGCCVAASCLTTLRFRGPGQIREALSKAGMQFVGAERSAK